MVGLTGEFLDVWQGKELALRGPEIGIRLEQKPRGRRGWDSMNTGENSRK